MTERPAKAPSARTRILGWYVLLLAIALVAGLLIQRSFLLRAVTSDVNKALDQEVGELEQLVEVGIDPDTGEPFAGDLAVVFTTYLERNVALEGEAVVTIIQGQPYRGDAGGQAYRETALVERWSAIEESTRETVETPDGQVRYLAIPMLIAGEQEGVFVVAVNMEQRLGAVDDLIRIGALVYGSIFLLASLAAWIVAGSVLGPLRLLGETARSISETDLTQRIPVEGDDEIAELARTFNAMLDRLEGGFANQRRFVDDAGHELRTPITVIRGNLELLGDDPAERADTVRLVTTELDSMARIVDDLLALAKAEQPDFLQTHPIDLPEFVDEIARRAESLGDRSLTVEPVAPLVFAADGQRLNQAVMNLIRNAYEHTPPESEVTLRTEVDDGH
ncbi:MAG: sensor histidine kinase, partial [Acidimicrobiia bacterium]